MNIDPISIEINAGAADAYQQLSAQRQRTLMAPEDDMWRRSQTGRTPLVDVLQLVGRRVDEDNQLHGFYVIDEFERPRPNCSHTLSTT